MTYIIYYFAIELCTHSHSMDSCISLLIDLGWPSDLLWLEIISGNDKNRGVKHDWEVGLPCFILAIVTRRMGSYSPTPARASVEQSCPTSHRQVMRTNIYCCMLPRFLWFVVMQQKLSTELFSLATAKGTYLMWSWLENMNQDHTKISYWDYINLEGYF